MPFQCIWLKFNGSWPLKTSSKKPKPGMRYNMFAVTYSLWAWYVIVLVGITICFQTAFLVKNFGDIIMITENCCTTFMGALNFVRLLHLRFNQRKFRELIKQFAIDIWIPDNLNANIAKECRKRMTTFQVMTVLLSCLILMYCVLPLVELFWIVGIDASIKPFPYKMHFPYDPNKNWIRYILTYLFTAYAGICVVTTLFAEDSLLGFFITHMCGQFCLLHERIDALRNLTNKQTSFGKNMDDQIKQMRSLKQASEHHNKLIW
ncbi:uncharacterized protein Dvir_GJ17123 [Drosophila virilis]|uniref:Odorant receptor n=1 Tax=Drosophila virilis TaxID=7244 RepID=B4MCD2_DROVI|nr:uncharacterized protein Dvir_GJ17123 [Drosophila virilis]